MNVTGRRPSAWWVLAIAAAVPALVSGALALHGGWAPTIDIPIIAVRSHDALTRHPPLVGIYQALTTIAHSPERLHHLGPLEFWLMGLPVRLGNAHGSGLVVAASLINAAAAAASVWVAHRLGGVRLAAIVTGAVALLSWSLGGQVLHDPWNPHLALFSFLLFVVTGAAIGGGDLRLLPLAAFAGSLVLQLHLTYAVPLVAVSVWAIVGLVLTVRAGAVVVSRADVRRWSLAAGVVAVLCWIGPVIDEIFRTRNATNVASGLASDYARVGLSVAWRDLVHALAVPALWMEPHTNVISPDRPPGAIAVVTAVAVLVALGLATARAWARRDRIQRTLCTTAVVLCAAGFVTALGTPVAYRSTSFLYPRRFWWIIGVTVWVALASSVVDLVRARRADRGASGVRASLGFGLAAIALCLVAVAPRLGPTQDYGSAGFGPVRALGAALAPALRGSGPWEVRSEGAFARGVVGAGVVGELVLRGRDAVVADANYPDFGAPHVVRRRDPPAGRVLVVSGPDAGKPRPGYRLVARWDPATAPAPYRDYHQTLLVIPVEPVAAYVSL